MHKIRIEPLQHHVHDVQEDLNSFMFKKFLPQFEILDGILADGGKLCLKTIQDV